MITISSNSGREDWAGKRLNIVIILRDQPKIQWGGKMKGAIYRNSILALTVFLFFRSASDVRPVFAQAESCRSVAEAVQAGDVELTLEANNSEFYNEPLDYSLENLTGQQLEVCFPAGLTMISGSGAYQNLVLTKTVTVLLPPNGKQEGRLPADCMNLSKDAPAAGGRFALGAMAQGDLLRVAQTIDRQSAQGRLGAQLAIWAVTDGLTLEEIGGGADSESAQLLQVIAPLLCLAGDEIDLGQSLLQESESNARLFAEDSGGAAAFCASRGLPANFEEFAAWAGRLGTVAIAVICGGFCLCGILVIALITGIILLIRSRK